MDNTNEYLLNFKDCYFHCFSLKVDLLEHLDDFEIRDDDVFIIIYPKSGKFEGWQILSLIYFEGHRNRIEMVETRHRVSFLEYSLSNIDHARRHSPRIFTSHLPYYLIIYIYRNSKDVLISYFHFSKFLAIYKAPDNVEQFMEKILDRKVVGSLWFDHIRGWYEHRCDFNILFMMYEEMKKVRGESYFLIIASRSFLSLVSMNYILLVSKLKDELLGTRNSENPADLEDSIVGDWKHHLTREKNERFDKIFPRKMEDFHLKFTWD
uniref:Sulfotransferase n=1 Tax=Sus scrofa TaxID=9823 RepID=A0A8D1ZJJ3_PIG